MLVPVLIAALVAAPVPFRAPVHLVGAAPGRPSPAAGALGDAAYATSDRLRPQGDRVAGWLRDARRRSPTVQRLVDRIEQSDVIVYLDISRNLAPNVAACLTWMAATNSRRIVRASFRMNLGVNDAIAMLAHELQHVVEVIDHPEVRSTETLLDLYTRIGHATGTDGLRWDTADAVALGTLARFEAVNGFRPAAGADVRKGT
jgi:hypothetical protein